MTITTSAMVSSSSNSTSRDRGADGGGAVRDDRNLIAGGSEAPQDGQHLLDAVSTTR